MEWIIIKIETSTGRICFCVGYNNFLSDAPRDLLSLNLEKASMSSESKVLEEIKYEDIIEVFI